MFSAEQRGSSYAICSGLLYGLLGYFGMSLINAGLSASNMLFWRFFISSLVMLVILLPMIKQVRDTWHDVYKAFIGGAVFYSLSTIFYFIAAGYVGTGLAMVIFFTYPAIIMVINYFIYKQSIPTASYLAITIIMIGMSLFVDWDEMKMDLIGVGLGCASAFFYACYMVFSKHNKASPNISTLMVTLGSAATFLVFSLLNHTLAIPSGLPVWGNLVGIAIISTAVPILLLLHSLKYINTDKAAILSVLEPVFVVIFGVLLLGEQLKFSHMLGVVIVLSGALLSLFSYKIKFTKIQSSLT